MRKQNRLVIQNNEDNVLQNNQFSNPKFKYMPTKEFYYYFFQQMTKILIVTRFSHLQTTNLLCFNPFPNDKF